MKFFKPLRVCIAAAFFMPTAFLFLDIRETGMKALADKLLFWQFVPSLLSFLNHAAAGATGFIIVLALTLAFGRIYCSAVCPLGIFQDIISRLFSKKAKRRYTFSLPRNILRYTLLSVTILVFLAGSNLLLNLLDPFSSFGRIFANFIRPIVIALNNLTAPLTEFLGSHALYRVQWPVYVSVSVCIALAALGVVAWMSARHGRIYCNTLCPVGTLLGLVSKVSLFKIGIILGSCRSCGDCRRVCKAGCIDVKNKQVDVSRCISCFNCLTACPDQALTFRPKPQISRVKSHTPGRRGFILALAAGSAAMASDRVIAAQEPLPVQVRPTTIPEKRTSPISPPGSVSIKRYTSICTACHLCVSACPSRVLVPSIFSFGLSGMLQPKMDFTSGHCNYDCTICSQICPSKAILPLSTEKKQQTQMGVAKFIKESCVVYTDNTNCGACSEHCPTKAVHMVPYLNTSGRKLVIPEINEAICVGCGGCEHACPTKPYKAIFVDGNPVHRLAEKPVEQKSDQKLGIDTSEKFPF